jgi:hypothetical protein
MTSNAALTSAADRDADVPDRRCSNCGAYAPGAYCPECGQNTRERLPTFAQFMREATGRYLSLEGKLWKTLLPLLFRPGFLTRAYFAGRRRRYIGPARLFLVSSLVLFAVLGFVSQSIELDNALQTENPPATNVDAKSDGLTLDDDLNINFSYLPEAFGVLKKRVDRFNQLTRTQKAERILVGALRYGPYAMFVLLPAFAALLKVVYLGGRRKHPARPRLYGEHLVFAAHNHAFLFVAVGLLFALPTGIARPAVALWIAAYLVLSMRTVYGGSWLGIVARGAALVVVYSVLFALVTAGLLVVAVLLR